MVSQVRCKTWETPGYRLLIDCLRLLDKRRHAVVKLLEAFVEDVTMWPESYQSY
jgi:hypothetical protein